MPPAARAALAKEAARWSAAALGRRLAAAAALAGRARREPRLGAALATRALWSLASERRAGG
jgi:hypothetical protein